MSDKEKQASDRRNVVKGITIGAGGITLSQWTKPVVETIVLPAHAQTTTGAAVLGAGLFGGGFFKNP